VKDRRIAIAGIVISLFVLYLAVTEIPKAIRIGFDLGTPGTYVVVDVPECTSRNCHTYAGTFFSDDGKVTRTAVHVRNGLQKGLKQGDRLRAFDIGDPREVYTSEGGGDYPTLFPFVFTVLGLAALALGLRGIRSNRKPPSTSDN
jgi:hypothetical protein